MYNLSRFTAVNGIPDREEVETWAENYFHNLLTLLNAFFSQVEIDDALDRMRKIPFAQLVVEELENESEEVKKIAVDKVMELVEIEIRYMEAYAGR
ncbi:hypothetical protein SAMN02745221_00403 [Thermosyntropha lipolytica DSM 11003]|uniref:Uncharacterized protein n=1 Tax=Thermosyntropha lipolytica DSM 11003 TaxID=1123382 RepID=A0A1M5KIZ2_9FIRM|nr:hypothetical protein [Thermosyntropha lipolytica]SHG52816.1 hypothetical protein SAMN02745221_00403 [Thermosyntropha lipolytica DSM 11003]